MASPLNAVDLVSLVRRKVKDASSEIWTDAEILEYADEALEELFITARLAGGEHLLETDTWAPADFTEIETDVWSIEIAEKIAAVRRIEVQGADTNASFMELPQIELEERGTSKGAFSSHAPVWYRAGGDRTIFIEGTLNSFPIIRHWYYRRWPPMHSGTADSGSASTLALDATPTGITTLRDDLYNGIYIELLVSQDLRKISDFVGSTRVATVTPDFTVTVDNTVTYALVSPLEPEHNSLLVNQTALILLEDAGQDADMILKSPRYQHLYNRFRSGMSQRDHARPRRLYSRRAGNRR